MDGPMALYRRRVAEGVLEADPAQRLAVEKLQLLAMRLQDYHPARPKRVGIGFFGWGRDRLEEKPVPGLYLYGGVGRGKSMLMDLFFAAAPVEPKRRVHFHAFMQEMHKGIAAARAKGATDPVVVVADQVADGATLLCFDEMQITDITDAMLVGRLFQRLFERGVVIVTTSNRAPDELYKDGLNRHLFLPFIAMLKDRLEVHELESARDHRLDRLKGEEIWPRAARRRGAASLDAAWQRLAGGAGVPLALPVQGRQVVLPAFRNSVARASFAELCGQPLGPADYLAIAGAVDVLVLEGIPTLSRARNNEAKRFVTLVDALYEAKVRLVCSAAASPIPSIPRARARSSSSAPPPACTRCGAPAGARTEPAPASGQRVERPGQQVQRLRRAEAMVGAFHQRHPDVRPLGMVEQGERHRNRHFLVGGAVQQADREGQAERAAQHQIVAAVLDQTARDRIGLLVGRRHQDATFGQHRGPLRRGHFRPHRILGEVRRRGDPDQTGDPVRPAGGEQERDPAAHAGPDEDLRTLGQPVQRVGRVARPVADRPVLEPAGGLAVAGIVELEAGAPPRPRPGLDEGRLGSGAVGAKPPEEHDAGPVTGRAVIGKTAAVRQAEERGAHALSGNKPRRGAPVGGFDRGGTLPPAWQRRRREFASGRPASSRLWHPSGRGL